MNHDQSKPDALEHEQDLLAHFRTHSHGEPSAELDARILAAANAAASAAAGKAPETGKAVSTPDERASWGERLHGWLFGTGRQRWSVAVAGLACLGVGVSLTWRTLEQTPDTFDAVPHSVQLAPTAAPMAAKRAESAEIMARQLSGSALQEDAAEQRKAVPQLRMQAAPAMLAEQAPAEALAELVAKAEPRDDLLQLLALRRAGEQQAAAELLARLQAEHPQLDIEAELVRLEKDAQ